MDTRRYHTQSNPFQKEYAENALLQKGFNSQIIADLAQYLLRKLPASTSTPVSILDLCCGDGGSTSEMLKHLDDQGIKVDKIVGVDIAPEQIERAKLHSLKEPRLEFRTQDIETISDQEKYDVVVSLFGLHWIENLPDMVEKISRALKPGGVVVFFVPLEKTELFALRQQLMSSQQWQNAFKGFSINPFADSPGKYLESFSKYFTAENPKGIHGDQPVYFTEEQFVRFLSSWMQEVRFLQDKEKAGSYLKELVGSVAPGETPHPDIVVFQDDNKLQIRFLEKFFWYHGSKKKTDVCEQQLQPDKQFQAKL